MDKLTIRDVDIKGKQVLIRVDFNVPLDKDGIIADDIRIKSVLPTIRYVLSQGAKVILISHLGRPKGKVVENLRLDPVAKRLQELLGQNVAKLDDCVGEEVARAISQMKEGDIILLENLRFHAEEEENHPGFAKELASLADIFVNDAFGAAHRAHASVEGITKYLPSVAGLLLMKEIEYFEKVLHEPTRPFIGILGGAKVSDKIGVIENLMDKVDGLLIGGGMSYTFLKAKGMEVGNSKVEDEKVEVARELLDKAKAKDLNFLLPKDHLVANKIGPDAEKKVTEPDIPEGWIGVDIGPKTIEDFTKVLAGARTIVWNGPLGIFEVEPFSQGTQKVAQFISRLENVTTIIGGGDTAAAIAKFGLEARMSHISTGGGASLEYLKGKVLPGIAALSNRCNLHLRGVNYA